MSTFRHQHVKKAQNPQFFTLFDFQMCFAPQRRALFRHFFDIWTSKSGPRPSVFNTFDLEMCFAPQRRALFRHRNLQKWSEPLVFCVLYILTWKCASRHNGVHFFDIATSKSGPTEWVLFCLHFDFKMCFAPRTACNFLTSQLPKWSENGVFCTFWLYFKMCFAPRQLAPHPPL